MLKDLLPEKAEEGEPEPEGEPKKRPTLRDEEASMNERVRAAVKEFLAKEPPKDEGEPKKEPERVPAASVPRKIEKWLWGKE